MDVPASGSLRKPRRSIKVVPPSGNRHNVFIKFQSPSALTSGSNDGGSSTLTEERKKKLEKYLENAIKSISSGVRNLLRQQSQSQPHDGGNNSGGMLLRIYRDAESVFRLGRPESEKLWNSLVDNVIVPEVSQQVKDIKGGAIEIVRWFDVTKQTAGLLQKLLAYLDQGILRAARGYSSGGVDGNILAIVKKEFEQNDIYSQLQVAVLGLFEEVVVNSFDKYSLLERTELLQGVADILHNGDFNDQGTTITDTFKSDLTSSFKQFVSNEFIPSFDSRPISILLGECLEAKNRLREYDYFLDMSISAVFLENTLLASASRVKRELPTIIVNDDSKAALALGQLFIIENKFKPVSEGLTTCIRTEVPRLLALEGTVLANEAMRFLFLIRKFTEAQTTAARQSELDRLVQVEWAKAVGENDERVIDSFVKSIDGGLNRGQTAVTLFGDDGTHDFLLHYVERGLQTLVVNKDTLKIYYKEYLSNRLLGNKSDLDREIAVMEVLKTVIGQHNVDDLETMIKDFNISRDLSREFRESLTSKQRIQFNARVLTEGKWPASMHSPNLALKFPPEMEQCMNKYTRFYTDRHERRKITWAPVRDLVVIKGEFTSGVREMYMNIFQALIVLQFNNVCDENSDGWLTYSKIAEGTGMVNAEAKTYLNPALHSLVAGKVRLLQITRASASKPNGEPKKGKVESFHDDDKFRMVKDLSTTKQRIVFTGYRVGGSGNQLLQNQGVRKQVERNRSLELQSAIVRVMKMRKRMSHVNLVSEVAELTKERGTLERSEFKRALEVLMAPGNPYIVRDLEDTSVYIYSA